MGLFKRKKKKPDMDNLLNQPESVKETEQQKKRVEHLALEYCEQIMNAAKDLDELKKEYRLVSDYLSDIQILEELPEQQRSKLEETAQNVISLNTSRETYMNKTKKISDVQYAQMQQLEEEMPDNIRQMQSNENYQSMVKRDMDYLEGEKGEWNYYLGAVKREQSLLRKCIWAVPVMFMVATAVVGILQFNYYLDMLIPFLTVILAAALGGGGIFLRMQNNTKEIKRAELNMNRAITLLNQMKAKYVNVTNAVDYACEKYHVRNAMELSYIWEQYLEEFKEREIYERNNDDFEYFSSKLVRELKVHKLYDAAIWINQAQALLDKKEMVEVKHYMLIRRQKLRARLELQVNTIQNAKKEILLLLKDKKEYQKEIVEVLKTVDKMCGLK